MRYSEDIKSRLTARHMFCMGFSGDLANKVVLNVGCWIGWYESFVSKKGNNLVVGIDVDYDALRVAKKSVSADGCEFICASATDLPFKKSSLNMVSLFDVLEHLPIDSESLFFSEANRVLETNGSLIVSVPNNNYVSRLLDPAYFLIGHRHYAITEIREFMEKAGFEIINVKYGGGLAEALSMILIYFFKHLFDLEVPFKSFFEQLRNKEYQGKGFSTLFVEAAKTCLTKTC